MDLEASGSTKFVLCDKSLSADKVGRAKWHHEFYKECIDNLIMVKGSCAGCKPMGECVKPKAPSRTSGKQATSVADSEAIVNIVAQQIQALQHDLLAQLTERMEEMIQTNVATQIQ